ncbi:MAG: formyl-CoA transferase [Chloroflexi bacterium]|nr:MAG: formyl-CoA transferase [Chloroflexota bacterium]
MIAAPYGASMLADFGADVIKIEQPGTGDPSRNLLPHVDDVSLRYAILNRNKRSVTLDLRTETGRDLFLRLVATSDMLVENFRPGTLERWGLDEATLREANPGIIVVRISGYGQTGPSRELAGFGTPLTAYSGMMYLTGYPDRPPVSPPISLADYLAGLTGAFAGLMALYHRDVHSGDGQVVDVSLYEPLFRMLDFQVAEFAHNGTVRERTPFVAAGSSPTGVFKSGDGRWVVLVTSTERTWQRLAEAIGRDDLLTDPRFRTNADRVKHNAALEAILTAWFAAHTYAEAQELLDRYGCPFSPVNSISDIFADPHYRAREDIVEVSHPAIGVVAMPGIVPKLSKTPGDVVFPGPALGAHNDDVLGGILGLAESEIAALRELGVI